MGVPVKKAQVVNKIQAMMTKLTPCLFALALKTSNRIIPTIPPEKIAYTFKIKSIIPPLLNFK
jgi:hypothetical protein